MKISQRFIILALTIVWIDSTTSFSARLKTHYHHHHATATSTTGLQAFKVSADELSKSLSDHEKTVVDVVRRAGPSVARVTSVWPLSQEQPIGNRDNSLPRGRGLGSGSAFVVDARGYLVTNFHVIETAYRLQQSISERKACIAQWIALPRVFVRIDSATQYVECEIVNVLPDLDVAVLKLLGTNGSTCRPLDFGSSAELLVGQTVIAIGNPFGLDTTVTTGVVSALDREFQTTQGNTVRMIRGAIQTDAAINPGNSGGPLLNARGQVIGLNTAIVTTSGSNAGIGFAVPSDQIAPAIRGVIRNHAVQSASSNQAWLGVKIVRHDTMVANETCHGKNWIATVEPGSPAQHAGLRPVRVDSATASVSGDSIVAIGGNIITTYDDLVKEMDSRKPGEKVQVTLEEVMSGARRVVEIALKHCRQ
jgi:S1-C subfamily serine protease